MIEDIYKKIWQLSPTVKRGESYNALVDLTQSLIALYDLQGRLSGDPFSPTRQRKLSLPFEQVNERLRGSVCLITGGLGCVGTALLQELLKFDVKKVVIIDNKVASNIELPENVVLVSCDVRDAAAVTHAFLEYQPAFVFHTAAQRDPGYAESHIFETVSTNVIGTLNIVKACEASGSVIQCVFSSTGKASRYFTEEIYAGSKKMCEFILDAFAKKSSVKYCMVRFTHILDNSLMNQQLMNECANHDYIAVHCPGKFVTAQNVKEAAYLMLNTLVYAEDRQCNFLLVRNLEWPVESLEMALYYVKESGRSIPVIFMGNPIGYTEKFFRGQMDWSNPQELNLLINVYEQAYRRYNQDNDIIISHISPVSEMLVIKALQNIAATNGEEDSKKALLTGLKEIVRDSLNKVDKQDTVNILNWGLQQKFLEIENAKMADYGPIIPMMFESLEDSVHFRSVDNLLYQKA
ncbi:MAG TPA: polysaccharide biosynthesis protein [Chryseolinea sp.]|nr:polysaccharide biosynthesis protein [Chryseolinea sp.]